MSRKIAVVLAAGKGTRMNSELPKVLIEACGRPIIDYVLDVLAAAGIDTIVVVVGYRSADVRKALDGRPGVVFVEQTEQLGTGHAVMCARGELAEHTGPVLVVTGDSPMMQQDSVRALFDEYERTECACVMGTALKDDPSGLGRVVRDADGSFMEIVEEKDASDKVRRIKEVNMSCYVFDSAQLVWALDRLQPNNRQGEYYVTDCPGILRTEGKDVRALAVLKPVEALSINTPEDLAAVEQAIQGGGQSINPN